MEGYRRCRALVMVQLQLSVAAGGSADGLLVTSERYIFCFVLIKRRGICSFGLFIWVGATQGSTKMFSMSVWLCRLSFASGAGPPLVQHVSSVRQSMSISIQQAQSP